MKIFSEHLFVGLFKWFENRQLCIEYHYFNSKNAYLCTNYRQKESKPGIKIFGTRN